MPCGGEFQDVHTLKAGSLGQEESGVLPRNGILSKAASGLQHLVESGYAVSHSELVDILADLVHDAGDVVARVGVLVIGNVFCVECQSIDSLLCNAQECNAPAIFQSLGFEPL